MVDGSEILNTSEIDNALKEKEYVFTDGITQESSYRGDGRN